MGFKSRHSRRHSQQVQTWIPAGLEANRLKYRAVCGHAVLGALTASLLMLTGCSTIQVAYNQAPTLSYWWLDGYFDFSKPQTVVVKSGLAKLQAWHRQQELPIYADLLARLQKVAEGPITPQQACDLSEQIQAAAKRLLEQSADALADWAPSLQPEQLSTLAKEFENDNRKWRKQWLDGSAGDLAKLRLKKTVDRFEDFYGRLEEPQLKVLRQSISTSPFDPRLAWIERQRRQQDMLTTLGEHAGNTNRASHVKTEMLALLVRSQESPDPVYKARVELWQAHACRTLADIHNSTSAEQRQTLVANLNKYEQDARILAKGK
ncbi:MAG: hypothetical protein EBQ69_10160 [Betaproteobacteria bacterium]|nr:hypothetical protein [Betaproteobacteria bacterium]